MFSLDIYDPSLVLLFLLLDPTVIDAFVALITLVASVEIPPYSLMSISSNMLDRCRCPGFSASNSKSRLSLIMNTVVAALVLKQSMLEFSESLPFSC